MAKIGRKLESSKYSSIFLSILYYNVHTRLFFSQITCKFRKHCLSLQHYSITKHINYEKKLFREESVGSLNAAGGVYGHGFMSGTA